VKKRLALKENMISSHFEVLTITRVIALSQRKEIILVTTTSTVGKDLAPFSALVVEIPRQGRPAGSHHFWQVAVWVQLIACKTKE